MAKSTILDRVSAAFSAQAKASAALRSDLDQLDAEIIATSNQLASLRDAPVDRAEIEQRVDAFLLEAETNARLNVSFGSISLASGSVAASGIAAVVSSSRTDIAFGGLIVLGFREQIRERIIAEAIEAAPGKPISFAEREDQTERLKVELSKLERIRESISREAEKHGLTVHRSEFADPAALLAPDGEV
ncbi:hypothetical protein RMR21_004355 [Agrobacterium sp. rho-8.1]|nr:hypothetical protein [Agrobacterium sp. rho-8.1]